MPEAPALQIDTLGVDFPRDARSTVRLIDGISFSVEPGKVLGIVGESGSGKTLTALAIIGLLPPPLRVTQESRAWLGDIELLDLAPDQINAIRGRRIGMVFQDAGAHLNPVRTIGQHLVEPLQQHLGLDRATARTRAAALLSEVGIADAHALLAAFPHELSGGQQQRVMIALALACDPEIIIADEPTSALDAGLQQDIVGHLRALRQSRGVTLVLISHDLPLVGQLADDIIVLRRGIVVERGPAAAILAAPDHDYTQQLLNARRALEAPKKVARREPMEASAPLIEAISLGKQFSRRSAFVDSAAMNAVQDVSLTIRRGETVALVGPSGSGKSTLGLLLAGLLEPSAGTVQLAGQDISGFSRAERLSMRRRVQLIFQDPYRALNPRATVRSMLVEAMRIHAIGQDDRQREARALQLLERVGLDHDVLDRLPAAFSGGQRQRISIARCLSLDPDLLICDECLSALDTVNQMAILDLLASLQAERGMSYLFIAHDLAVVRSIADQVVVMDQGRIVEKQATDLFFEAPSHPRAKLLVAAAAHNLAAL